MARDEYEPAEERLWELPLADFIERASGGRFKRPEHFGPIVDVLERIERLDTSVNPSGVRAVAAAPVQHGKTTLVEFAIAWILLRHPDRAIIYLTYAQRKAEKHSRRIRAIYLACGGKLKSDFNTIQQWQTEAGGGLLVTSRDGEITGNDAVHVFFDDPYKDREEAENADVRERLEEKFSGEVVTRVAPSGSIFIIASRWHEDDLSGTKIREGYEHVHLRAIELVEVGRDEDDNPVLEERALCPWGPDPRYPRTLAFLRALRDGNDVTEYDWASLYQGEPKPKGGGLFRGVVTVTREELPRMIGRAVGCDFAYSQGNDAIAIVVLGLGEDQIVYVLAVFVWQKSVLENLHLVRASLSSTPEAEGAELASYAAGPELGTIRHLAKIRPEEGGAIKVRALPAKSHKIVRAAHTARRWNNRGIRVLAGQPWTDTFVRRVCGFTGLDGARDDEVDGLVSGHDWLMRRHVFAGEKRGSYKAGARVM